MPLKMGIGEIGNEQMIFKRRFRWVLYLGDGQEFWWAKMAGRPSLTVEETEIHHLHERHMISGKPTWDSVSMTVYDCKFRGDYSSAEKSLHDWLNSVWKFSKEVNPTTGTYAFMDMGDMDQEYKQDMTLKMLDGHGGVMETWWLLGSWPSTVNWGEVDYSSSDTADVDITVRFDRAEWRSGDASFASGGAGPA